MAQTDFEIVYIANQTTPVFIASGFTPKGAYNAGTDYAVGDSVSYNGSSYVMYVDAPAGTLPTNTTYWQVIANGIPGTSGLARTVVVTSGSYTLGSATLTDYVYLVAGAHAGTLPTANGNSNRYTIKNNHSANVTVTRAGSDTIDGATSISIAPQSSVDLISNGSNAWNVV